MKVLPTSLPGVVLLELAVASDARGRVMETFHRDRYRAAGVACDFVQDNFSSSVAGVLRGLHFQRARPQGKLVHVTRGAVFDVAVDLRRGSPDFARWFGATLSADNRRQLWIPPGFAHGFVVTSAHADVVYKLSAPYDPDDDHAIRWDDPALAIAWPRAWPGDAPVLSPRDAAAPRLADAALPVYVAP
ncbi:MAG TPA: dTDP-4-dehydrorhamnose 3,5-epimerase [Kofleriaceae bacterium]|nr:dTDP-4-dehydrorhamnose 3,5-epimerase [Kofleriaceae bacterium]